jgi:hypothetical protein
LPFIQFALYFTAKIQPVSEKTKFLQKKIAMTKKKRIKLDVFPLSTPQIQTATLYKTKICSAQIGIRKNGLSRLFLFFFLDLQRFFRDLRPVEFIGELLRQYGYLFHLLFKYCAEKRFRYTPDFPSTF